MEVVIVGAGLIAKEYLKALNRLKKSSLLIGRGEAKVKIIQSEFPENRVVAGGLEAWLKKEKAPNFAIIATQVEFLVDNLKALILKGCKNILIEKPLCFDLKVAKTLLDLSNMHGAKIFIGYNRRSFASVIEAKRIIEKDGGVSSFHFDFTEALFRIDPKNYHEDTLQFWGISNSTHVLDTAFYLAGLPQELNASINGQNEIPWHTSGSIFYGAGVTVNKAAFTYNANWQRPGKWYLDLVTNNYRLIFSPFEQLQVQKKGSFAIEMAGINYSQETDIKQGFLEQTDAFINQQSENVDLCSLKNYIEALPFYNEIFGYKEK